MAIPCRRRVSGRHDRRPRCRGCVSIRPDRTRCGPGSGGASKKVYLIDLRRVDAAGHLEKRLVADLLRIRDPNGISLPARRGEFGVGDPFSFPLQSVESIEVLDGARLVIANDNNYPGNDGRWIARDRPDDVEMIMITARALR